MSDDDVVICPKCAIERVSFEILHEFTEDYPDEKMSWDAWTSLRYLIEVRMKQALGVEDPEAPDESESDAEEGHTVQ
jgi:hypothetical protein